MKLTWHGGTAFQQSLMRAAIIGPRTVVATLYQGAEMVMTASKRDYVPVDKGHLRASGFVSPPVLRGFVGFGVSGGYVDLGFGGPSAPYALIVHEDLTKRHKVGQAKYLVIPLLAHMQGMFAVLQQRTADAIRQSFQRLGNIEANVAAGRDVNFGQPLFNG